jgi:lipopolysaccharide export system protein LptC
LGRRERGRRWQPDFGRRSAPHDFGRSRFVALMKYLLPVLAMSLLALVVAWPQLVPSEDRLRIDLAAVGPAGGSKPQVLNPRVLGVDAQSRPFQITADLGSRTQTGDGRDIYLFDQPKADITMADGSWVAVTSDSGRYEEASKTLYLKDNVNLFHDSGYEFITRSARFDVVNDSASGDDPVHGQGPFGTLDSQGFRILDGGERIIFTGKARMTIYNGVSPSG